jgi:hypothetical protein
VPADVVVSFQLSLCGSDGENALSSNFHHVVVPGFGKLLFTARAELFLSENQIFLALKGLRRGVIVAGERFL